MTKVKINSPLRRNKQKELRERTGGRNMWILMNGKQVKIKRPPTIEGMGIDDFIQQNADPV